MKQHQRTLRFSTPGRGAREITADVARVVSESGVEVGLVQVFCRHTSCSLVIQENADPTVLGDLYAWLERIAPDGDPKYRHDAEGPDDMAAHLRMALTRTTESIPVQGGRLALGTWQGIFLCEHRTAGHRRELVVHVLGSSADEVDA